MVRTENEEFCFRRYKTSNFTLVFIFKLVVLDIRASFCSIYELLNNNNSF